MYVILYNGATLASAPESQLQQVEGNWYFPKAFVKMAKLVPSSTTTVCGWKGTASYFSIADGGPKDVAWVYEDPKPTADRIKGYLAFYVNGKVPGLELKKL